MKKTPEEEIGYKFKDKKLLERALTHSSFANEKNKAAKNNERLEFLGDSVLSVVVSKYLFFEKSSLPEGQLTKIRASLVCEQSIYGFASKLNLGTHLKLGKGEEASGGRKRPSILADAFEAVLAAIYIDGGIEAATAFVLQFIQDASTEYDDYKTILQEIIQQNKDERLSYKVIDQQGPDHAKQFTVEVLLNSNVIGKGSAKSKKAAEQAAAKEALRLFN